MKLSDEELVKRVLASDTGAFDMLVKRYQDAVYGMAVHMVKNFADAQDIAQDVFLTAYQNLHSLKRYASFASWLRGITVNFCKMWMRQKRELVSLDEMVDERSLFLESATPSPVVARIGHESDKRPIGKESAGSYALLYQWIVLHRD